jgi:hypothetical protein
MSQSLSPAAQAVLDEVLYRMSAGESDSYARWIAAAALRAAADRVEHHWDGMECVDYLCAIAAELRGAAAPTETP